MDSVTCLIAGIVFPNNLLEIKNNSKVGLQNAPNAFQLALIDGLCQNLNTIDVINLPFIGAYPYNYKKLFSPKTESFFYQIDGDVNANCTNIRFINLIFLKLYTREIACFKALKEYCIKHKNKKKINLIVYSVHLPFIRAAIKIKRKFPNVRIILIITDLPEYKNDIMQKWKKIIYDYDTHISVSEYNQIDGFILLTEAMANRVISNNQPYEIIEGLYRLKDEEQSATFPPKKDNIIFYSGTLAKRYNIMNLVQAVKNIDDPSLKLIICGSGSCSSEISEEAKKDSRIIFKGELPREEVLKLQKQSSLLVNPRTSDGEYTQYSFPSKTMEYLASGVPTLLYKLPGIPQEYYNYCFALNDTDISALSNKIIEFFNIPSATRKVIGEKAKSFIITHKSAKQQTRKIIELINKLS